MDEAAFFLIVESSRRQAPQPWAFQLALMARLSGLSDSDLEYFQSLYRGLYRLLGEAAAARWGEGDWEDVCHELISRGSGACELFLLSPALPQSSERGLRFPVPQELARRIYAEPTVSSEGAGSWERRAEAEALLRRAELPRAWRGHADPYVRALAWLAHPPDPHPELFDSPLRAGVYLAARPPESEQLDLFGAPPPRGTAALSAGLLEPLTAMLWLELEGEDLAPPYQDPLASELLDRQGIVRGLLPTLRQLLQPPQELLEARMAALSGRGRLSERDPLSMAQRLMEGDGGRLDPELAHTVVRWLLGISYRGLNRRLSSRGLEIREAQGRFRRALTQSAVQLGRPRPVAPQEQPLLDLLEQSPDDPLSRQVYGDWCAQHALAPQPVLLLRELDRKTIDGMFFGYTEKALVLALLGAPFHVNDLAFALRDPWLRPSLVAGLFEIGDRAAVALPAMEELDERVLDLDLAALRIWLAPGRTEWLDDLLERLATTPSTPEGTGRVRLALEAAAGAQPERLVRIEAALARLPDRGMLSGAPDADGSPGPS